MIRDTVVAALFLLLAACAAPGHIKETVSPADQARTVTMFPAYVYAEGKIGEGKLRIGLTWSSKDPRQMLITAETWGEPAAIPGQESLKFSIDGATVGLSGDSAAPAQQRVESSQYGFITWSSRTYRTDRAFIERIVNAGRVVVRLETDKGGADGLFSQDRAGSARPAFRAFLKKTAP
jgi:hypothetical protein